MSAELRRRIAKWLLPASTALLAIFWFSYRASHAWLASGYVDPVSRFGVQDEAVYSRTVLEMAERGTWLLPTFLDRISYIKPPLLYWACLSSLKLFGVSALALRLPSILAAAGVCVIAFLWVRRERSTNAALMAVILIACNYYWILLGSVNMTDALLVFFLFVALFLVSVDPDLRSGTTIPFVAVALAAAVLAKSVAALPAYLAIGIFLCFRKAPRWRIAALFAGSAAVLMPWFLHALWFHRAWFWKENIQTELLGHGVGGTVGGSPGAAIPFYAARLFPVDPILSGLGLIALGLAIRRKANRPPALILLWLGCSAAVLAGFGFLAATYLLPIVTGLAVAAVWMLPRRNVTASAAFLSVVLLLEIWKVSSDTNIVWTRSNVPVARALMNYCERRRPQPLFVIETSDEFFSASLPLPRVRYGHLNQGRAARRLAIDFQSLGVIVTSQEFDRREQLWPTFRGRLTAMGLPPWFDPRGTEVLYRDPEAIRRFIAAHPEFDFLVAKNYVPESNEHRLEPAGDGYFLLLSPPANNGSADAAPDRPHSWSCRL